MRARASRLPRRSATAVLAGVVCLTMSFGTASALGGNGHGGGRGGGGGGAALPPAATAASTCPYHFAWPLVTRYPRQADPGASYQYYALKTGEQSEGVPQSDIGFAVRGQFPYANWMSWTTVNAQVIAYSVISDKAIKPAPGSVNPFQDTSASVFSTPRDYNIIIVPGSGTPFTPGGPVPADPTNPYLVAAQAAGWNTMTFATDGPATGIAGRVYSPFPGYNRAGAFGPTNTPYAVISAFDLRTGKPIDCQTMNIWPDALVQDPNKGTGGTADASQEDRLLALANLTAGQRALTIIGPHGQYPPKPNRRLVQFFRGPLATFPGADVPSVPPPDGCAGYLNGRLLPNQYALIRIPLGPTFFDNSILNPSSAFASQSFDAKTVSMNVYGTSLQVYAPGNPQTSGINNQDIKYDRNGGITILVYPWNTGPARRALLAALARLRGWNLIKGSTQGTVAADQMIIRTKGIQPGYKYPISPNNNGGQFNGAPCGQDILGYPSDTNPAAAPPGTPLTGPTFTDYPATMAATPANMGPAAPQGVQCRALVSVASGVCELRLRRYIRLTGGRWTFRG